MKKLFSARYTTGSVNTAMLVLRVGLGILMMSHGYDKLSHFAATAQQMPNLLGLGVKANTALVIFAEFFCALFLVIGLFTRLATIPIIIVMGVALFKAHGGDVFGEGHLAAVFLVGFIALLFIGPGKISVDGMIGK